jgi:hypothetical protein
MNLDQALAQVRSCAARMDAVYKQPVFDEWVIVSLLIGQEQVLAYLGPRTDQFLQHFAIDFAKLRDEILTDRHGVGDFEFARDADGTHYDAFLVLSDGLFLICNNTTLTMNVITRDKRWLQAQVPFVEMSDLFRADPLVHNIP